MIENRVTILRGQTGLSQQAFSDFYGIPKRTVQAWEGEFMQAPDYVIDLLERAVNEDFPLLPGDERKMYVFVESAEDIENTTYFFSKKNAINYAKQHWEEMSESDRAKFTDDEYCIYRVDYVLAEWIIGSDGKNCWATDMLIRNVWILF